MREGEKGGYMTGYNLIWPMDSPMKITNCNFSSVIPLVKLTCHICR
jgi:hypothetical protein